MNFHLPGAIALLLCSLTSQEPVLVGASDHLVLRIQGPARMKSGLRATNVGALLASSESDQFWSYCKSALRKLLHEAEPDVGDRLATLLESLDGYAGVITVASSLTPHPEAWAGIEPDLGGVLVLEPDGATDLAQIAVQVRDGLKGTRYTVEELEVVGRRLPLLRTGTRGGIVLPTMIGTRLVAFFGEDIVGTATSRLVTEGAAFVPDEDFARASFGVRVSVPPLVALEMQDPMYEVGSTSAVDVMQTSGLASLREVRLTVRPRGPYVSVDTSLAFLPGVPRGIFAGLFPDSEVAPSLAMLVPESCRYWQAGKLRLDLATTATIELVAAWSKSAGDPLAKSVEHIREQIRGFLDVELDRDVFAHLSEDCIVLGNWFADRDDAEPEDPDQVGGSGESALFGFALRDRAAFEQGWTKLLGSDLGTWVRPETLEEVLGTTVHDLDGTSWALTDELFLVGFGPSGGEWLRAVLARRQKVMKDGVVPVGLPREIERRRRQAPAGFQGCGAFDMRGVFGIPLLELLDFRMTDYRGLVPELGEALTSLRPFLAAHELDRAASVVGWSEGVWTYRVLW